MVPMWINLFKPQNLLPSYSKNRHIKHRISSVRGSASRTTNSGLGRAYDAGCTTGFGNVFLLCPATYPANYRDEQHTIAMCRDRHNLDRRQS